MVQNMEVDEFIDKMTRFGFPAVMIAITVVNYLRDSKNAEWLEISLSESQKILQEAGIDRYDDPIMHRDPPRKPRHTPFTDEEIKSQTEKFRMKTAEIGFSSRLIEMIIAEWLPSAKTIDAELLDDILQNVILA